MQNFETIHCMAVSVSFKLMFMILIL